MTTIRSDNKKQVNKSHFSTTKKLGVILGALGVLGSNRVEANSNNSPRLEPPLPDSITVDYTKRYFPGVGMMVDTGHKYEGSIQPYDATKNYGLHFRSNDPQACYSNTMLLSDNFASIPITFQVRNQACPIAETGKSEPFSQRYNVTACKAGSYEDLLAHRNEECSPAGSVRLDFKDNTPPAPPTPEPTNAPDSSSNNDNTKWQTVGGVLLGFSSLLAARRRCMAAMEIVEARRREAEQNNAAQAEPNNEQEQVEVVVDISDDMPPLITDEQIRNQINANRGDDIEMGIIGPYTASLAEQRGLMDNNSPSVSSTSLNSL